MHQKIFLLVTGVLLINGNHQISYDLQFYRNIDKYLKEDNTAEFIIDVGSASDY